MHKQSFNITIDDLSKIEGHTDLEIAVRDGKVVGSKLKIDEIKRFFRTAAIGKPALGVHQLVSRICGTCSIAHLLCCINCVENALGIEPSAQTTCLRDLLLYGLNIRDHAMHLYIFCLPDVLGKDSVLDFADEGYEHGLLHKAFDIKGAGNALSTLVGGRAVHAPFPQVGGFMRIPKKEDMVKMAAELRAVREAAVEFVDVFHRCDFRFDTDTTYIALRNDRFSYLGGDLMTSDGLCIGKRNFRDHVQKFVIPYSQAPGFEFEGKSYVVGALARMNMNRDTLHRDTRKSLGSALSSFPSDNIFHNNLAQAIEVVHCIDSAIELLESADFREEKKPEIKPGKSEGIGVLEAPRGTLYYRLGINEAGAIDFADLVIPTSQNQIKMDKDIGSLVQSKLDGGVPREDIPLELEKLIRAYDPCMSCATHFLKVGWKGPGMRPEAPSGAASKTAPR